MYGHSLQGSDDARIAVHQTDETTGEFPYGDIDLAIAMSFVEAELASLKAIIGLLQDQPAEACEGMSETCRCSTGEVATLRLMAEEVERVLRNHSLLNSQKC
jgi:hypothetical protein